LRVATFNAALSRRGPGLLLRDILTTEDAQSEAAAQVVAAARADVLLLTGIDWDHDLLALGAFADRVAAHGLRYDHRFAWRPNTGWQTGLDMVGDGRHNTADDAQGYGAFTGVKGMGLLSRLPIARAEARDFSGFLWRDLPGALLPQAAGADAYPEAVLAVQRLSTTGHWDVPVVLPDGGRLHVLAWYATPPVFGGPHDRNLRRNHDETRFWSLFLDGALPMPPPAGPFVLMGDANLDAQAGDGMSEAMAALLAHPALQDPAPSSAGARAARGPVPHDLGTVLWDGPRQPGNLRVDYVLPSADLRVRGSGVLWPAPGDPLAEVVATAARHRLVWVNIALP
ncbi:endonuclease/exonuclease/phosphatase family protein, partial [Rhodobaculum claviforme]|uniref:endonuclease/exonuclease/phosphatase family protein n=1 Tax=Rhodobaculum claviforme TaxID=1549854 RepID=UPI0030842537